jgi:peptide/nickel transport system substrate-binding protein
MEPKKIHPLIPQAQEQLRQGNISRRDFLRLSTLLGLSLASAQFLASCAQPPAATEAPPAATEAPQPTEPPMPTFVRGGTLKAASRVDRADHPARFSLVSQAHVWRHVFEYLTSIDAQGVSHPYLLESWEASDDLLTWTLKLRQGIKFNDGSPFTADDVLFNFSQWLDDAVGSSLKGGMPYLDPNGFEKVDDFTIVCTLKEPTIFFPEHMAQYQAAIVKNGFKGDPVTEPIGTGAFTISEFVAAERAVLKARKDYWRKGKDDQPLPYLDEIIFLQFGEDRSADVNALLSGEVDTIIEPSVTVWQSVKDQQNLTIVSTPTSATRLMRMRVDQDPWKDNKVRQALKHCHNREKILALALEGQGVIGNDSHVSPAHPEFVDVAPFPYDVEKAKSLLSEAGLTAPVKIQLTVASDWPESMAYAQALKEDAAGAFDIELNPMPATQYWDGWTEWNLGITWWAHRPLAPMTLPLAYTADETGAPVAWNESKWVDPEFDALVKDAMKTLDLAKRTEIVGKIEEIQKDRGSICTPFWMNVWKIYTTKVHDVDPSPEEYAIFYETWKDA